MSQPDAIAALMGHPAVAALSHQGQGALQAAAQLLRFETGQALSRGDQIGSAVLLLVEGQARLLSRDRGRLCTVEKLVSIPPSQRWLTKNMFARLASASIAS